MDEWASCAEDIVLKYFEKNEAALSVLSAKGLIEAVSRFTKYKDSEAINLMLE